MTCSRENFSVISHMFFLVKGVHATCVSCSCFELTQAELAELASFPGLDLLGPDGWPVQGLFCLAVAAGMGTMWANPEMVWEILEAP